VAELRRKAKEYCGKGVPEEAFLFELGWSTEKMMVTYVQCEQCGKKRCYVDKNRGQEMIKDRQRWCEC